MGIIGRMDTKSVQRWGVVELDPVTGRAEQPTSRGGQDRGAVRV